MISEKLIAGLAGRACRRYLSFNNGSHAELLPTDGAGEIVLYLHVPFCRSLCPFCSFHRVEYKEERAKAYFSALRHETGLYAEKGYRFSEVYVGGGTPTIMPDELAETVQLLRDKHPVTQVSVETNPDDLKRATLELLAKVSVNRLSVGVQSLDDRLLRKMERFDAYGSSRQIRDRLGDAQGKFDTLNVDMIFNLPEQDASSLQADIDILTGELGIDQISWYPLMATASTAKAMARSMGHVDFSKEQHFYRVIVERMLKAGYRRTSAWCFSRQEGLIDEYISEQDEYLGLGSGAFSYLDGTLYASTFSINHYLELLEKGQSAIVRSRGTNDAERRRYYLLMNLFSGSLDIDDAEKKFSGNFARGLRRELAALTAARFVARNDNLLVLTEKGYELWVVLMREFFTGVNALRDEMRLGIRGETPLIQRTNAT